MKARRIFVPCLGSGSRQGFALVVVLAFVALLVVLVLAYFSHSALQREVSNSSASVAKADIFAKGAMNAIIGDLQQEIAAGSTSTTFTAGGTTNFVFTPTNSSVVVPAISGFTMASGLENLVKISKSGSNFFSGSSYNTATYSPAIRAANIPTSSASKNGRSMSSARWNAPLFLAPTSSTDYTPKVSFTLPDWILVNRAGENPTSWNNNMRWSAQLSDTNVVVGRYAYAIHNEGGLLDANVAGYFQGVGTNAPPYKTSIAYADLSALKDSSGNTLLSQADVDQIVNWRNYATTLGGTSGTNYVKYVTQNQTGNLRTGNKSLYNGESDRRFTSRQQLIEFFKKVLGGANDVNKLSALEYFTTFSRDINQPSYSPDSNRPKVVAVASGGNDAYGLDSQVNPSYLQVRNSEGDPVAKKRFPLERLSWLTYKGPSASRAKSDADITDLLNLGIAQELIDQGTAANILKSFGLTWKSGGYWTYETYLTAGGAIKSLAQVAAESPVREPNFIELLKASISAGSLGRGAVDASGDTSVPSSSTDPRDIQYVADTTLDYQVIQIAANIIDQADVDGYPTRIRFYDKNGSGQLDDTEEFRGVENLPYLNRVRTAAWRIKEPAPVLTDPLKRAQTPRVQAYDSNALNICGVSVLVQVPEIWNPHNYNSTDLNRSLGYPRPDNLRLEVESTAGTGIYTRFRTYNTGGATENWPLSVSPRTLSASNTRMTFKNGAALYREPTLLVKRNVPSGSDLASDSFKNTLSSELSAAGVSGVSVTDSGVQLSGATSTQYSSEPSPAGQYMGVYIGKAPLLQNYVAGDTTFVSSQVWMNTSSNRNDASKPSMTYRLLCDDPNSSGYLIYDEKPLWLGEAMYSSGGNSTILDDTSSTEKYSRQILGADRFVSFFDPRASRFGGVSTKYTDFAPGRFWVATSAKWLDESSNQIPTSRPDYHSGYGFGQIWGAIPASSLGWQWDNGTLRLGLFTQNSRSYANDRTRFTGDSVSPGSFGNEGNSSPQYYADPDGVVRRAMGGYVTGTSATGLPMATAFGSSALTGRQKESRPMILNRPFRSVAELGYVFSGTPWKNLDFATPESGYASLLDAFCITGTENEGGLAAGKVSLNTRQAPVLKAILKGAYRDEYSGSAANLSDTEAETFSKALVTRTSGSKGPLINVRNLAGDWVSGSGVNAVYDGFSADLTGSDDYSNNISRYREAAVRALSGAGQTRVWNLMIDLVAQVGRYPVTATGLDDFIVEGEQRFWIHVAIDRWTGQVVSKQIELVKE